MMKRATAIIYASSLGNTAQVAEKLQKLLPGSVLIPAKEATPGVIAPYHNLILGTSTWGSGVLHGDFEFFTDMMSPREIKGKTVALFGLGDQQNYPDTFCDAMGVLHEVFARNGANIIGQWPAEEYDFTASKALNGDVMVGLALDENNEPDLTDYRIKKWVEMISPLL